MIPKKPTGAEIRQTFLDFFVEHKHTIVPSASLVPGGDATLLFTNAGMVQFKDIFLGTDRRPYSRAVNSQKCMRVAGKHNDLDDVGRDDWHHTFFEMLGNWSFGDYYKKEAIAWSWQLLTEVWGLPKDRLYGTCFKDELGSIPTDDVAAEIWKAQPGMDPEHILFFGRKENFWEMAETGPCGPCSEIHIDRGEEFCDLKDRPHNCAVNGDCTRFLELWNNVFIQYNRLDAETLEPLPATHVDTGMGFERIVSVLQGVDSNYKTDLFAGALDVLCGLTGESLEQVYANFTPYRVIMDHARAAAFLIADGVVPGNIGRNYVCRMIIRRAARFGTKIGLQEPFLARVAEALIVEYGDFYAELVKNRAAILDSLTREEVRFARTVEAGTAFLEGMLDALEKSGGRLLDGGRAFELYATYGLPFEITRDIARERSLEVDEPGFRAAMGEHRIASGGGKAMGTQGGEDADFYAGVLKELQKTGQIGNDGVAYNSYEWLQVEGPVLALAYEGQSLSEAGAGDRVEVLIPRTGFYVESGGQVSDEGQIRAADGSWEIEVDGMRKPAAGVIIHAGEVLFGHPRVGDMALAIVDAERRHDTMRNHTATHLMHKALHVVLGEHARQAGSLVAPDRLRFDFNHPEALTLEQLERIEKIVNDAIAADLPVAALEKPREQALAEGAMALFGEKYGETVRTLTIGDGFSYELCGGTHLERTSDVGAFLITSEGSAAAGVRRIEAVTGRGAYELIARRSRALKQAAVLLGVTPEGVAGKVETLVDDLAAARKQMVLLRQEMALAAFSSQLSAVPQVAGIPILTLEIPTVDADTLRLLTDRFRQKHPSGVCVLASAVDGRPIVIAAVTDDLIKRGLHAGELVKHLAAPLGGSGGGRPNLAQAGGKDAGMIPEALASVAGWVEEKLR
ncbi:MAG: alanine--tRNA ligase [Anaerolineales bacterium]|nr:alanine--tRNA ligase [Anaerolineales bacterium]